MLIYPRFSELLFLLPSCLHDVGQEKGKSRINASGIGGIDMRISFYTSQEHLLSTHRAQATFLSLRLLNPALVLDV